MKGKERENRFPNPYHKDLLCLVQTAYELSWCSHKTGSFTPFASTVPRNADERETWKQSQWEIMMAIPLPHYASIVKDDSKTKASIMSCHSFKSIAAINRPSLYPPPPKSTGGDDIREYVAKTPLQYWNRRYDSHKFPKGGNTQVLVSDSQAPHYPVLSCNSSALR